MLNKKITKNITQGIYVLTTKTGGCIVDAVSQVSAGDHPLISVAVMKTNYTNALMHENDKFALSILQEDIDPKVIETFGLKSMKNVDKFAEYKTEQIENQNIISESLGYMICEKVDAIENDTHTIFIGRLVEAEILNEGNPMSYAYYQNHKDDLVKKTTENGKTAWVCTVCGYVYYGEELPSDFKCPMCGVNANLFEKRN